MIPKTMKALQIKAYDGRLDLVNVPVPQPGPGQVLVQIAAAPVNPSDLKFIEGLYGVRKPLPVVAGFEGSGTAVAAGPGLMGRFLMGKRVSCMATATGGGSWAEFMVADARRCIPLKKHISLEQGAMMVVNPWTAWALLDTARRGGHRAAIHGAAASALGRMLVGLPAETPIPSSTSCGARPGRDAQRSRGRARPGLQRRRLRRPPARPLPAGWAPPSPSTRWPAR